jgi:hypothetical protein
MTDESKNMPIVANDGFDPQVPSDRVIIGERLKWTSEDGWIAWGEPVAETVELLAVGCSDFLQMWHDKRVVEVIADKPLPDIDILNDKVPVENWEKDFSGNPKPPWVHTWAAYFLNPKTGDRLTYLNSTFGARIAVLQLKDRVSSMRMLRGANVTPLVTLGDKPMVTRFGTKSRPDFQIKDWVLLGGNNKQAASQLAAPLQPAPTSALTKVAAPTASEVLNDDLPF